MTRTAWVHAWCHSFTFSHFVVALLIVVAPVMAEAAETSRGRTDDALLRIDSVDIVGTDSSVETLTDWDEVSLPDGATRLLRTVDPRLLRPLAEHERGGRDLAVRPFPYDELSGGKLLLRVAPERNTLRNFLMLLLLSQ